MGRSRPAAATQLFRDPLQTWFYNLFQVIQSQLDSSKFVIQNLHTYLE